MMSRLVTPCHVCHTNAALHAVLSNGGPAKAKTKQQQKGGGEGEKEAKEEEKKETFIKR